MHSAENRKLARLRLLAFVAPLTLISANTYAQTVSDAAVEPDAEGEIPAIVVTATRGRAQNLQTVPMAVSAIQADTLARQGVGSITDIVKSVPSVNIVQRGPGQSQVTVRGIASGAFSLTETGDRPLVSMYLDDVPISIQGANPDLKVYDLERIELLRGPQGTLYGAGSMAGTIRYITVKPSADAFTGSAEAGLSSTSHAGEPNWNFRASINAPLTESLAVLLSGYTGKDAGFIDNAGIGKKDANDVRTTQARGALRWNGVPDLTLDASLLYSRVRADGLTVAYSGLPSYTYDSLAPEYYNDDLLIGNVTAEVNVGDVKISSSTSYLDRDYASQISGFYYEYLFDFIFGSRRASPSPIEQRVKTFTQEFRIVSDTESALSWSAGFFFERTRRRYEQNVFIAGGDAATGLDSIVDFGTPFVDDMFYGLQHIKERQFALFGELTYRFSPQMDFTAGGRYFNFKQSFDLSFTGYAGSAYELNPAGSPTYLPLSQTGKPKADGFNPRFVLSYKPDDHAMVFAEASRGFRYGSVNEPVASQFCNGLTGPVSVGPDNLWNYAVGLKSDFADRAVTFNVTGFFIDWKDVQSRVSLACGYYYRVNQGHVQSRGIELESTVRPVSGLTFSFNGSYTNAKAKSDVITPDGIAVSLDGDRAPMFPRWIMAVSSEYSIPLEAGHLTASAGLQYRSSFYNRFRPTDPNYRETPDQTMVNASLTYAEDGWEIGIFGTNLTNSAAYTLVDAVTGGGPDEARFYGTPRTVGLRAKLRI